MNKLHQYAPVILRIGLAGVFIWFGLSQIISQTIWIAFIPRGLVSLTGIPAATFVIMNGWFETVCAVLLAYGLLIRPVAALLFLHMLFIIGDVGLSPIGMRDVAIAIGLLAVACYGKDILSWTYAPKNPPTAAN